MGGWSLDMGPLGPWTLTPVPEFETARMKPPMNIRMMPTDKSFLKLGSPCNILEPGTRTLSFENWKDDSKPVQEPVFFGTDFGSTRLIKKFLIR
jgi:hypothetical protein